MNPEQEAAERPRRIGVLVAVAAAALAADAISKVIVVATLQDRPPVELINGLLTLRVLRNSGAAFNIGIGMTYVFTVIATAVVVAILRYARRLRSLPWAVTLGLLLGGALGNLADRLLRSPGPLRGHVVDWIELPHWPVFNLADSAIVCGGALAVVLASRGLQVDGTVYRDEKKDERAERDSGTGEADAPAADGPDGERNAPAEPASGTTKAPGGANEDGARPTDSAGSGGEDDAGGARPAAESASDDGPADADSASDGVTAPDDATVSDIATAPGDAVIEGGAPKDNGRAAGETSVRDAKH
ncbi:signal peptidase II [Actinoallomurus sp. CA-150999]|uniref:signal peptidase II n=1 Tax=Actinoallomurus sp. CA-150999 TaxID=3239887 RepID=UPI003D89CF0C